MKTDWKIFQAMLHCPYKAWLLTKEIVVQDSRTLYSNGQLQISLASRKITLQDKLALIAWGHSEIATGQSVEKIKALYGEEPFQTTFIKIKHTKKSEKLLFDTRHVISKQEPPPFYRNKHCPECQYKDSCHQKLKEKDCISQLGGITSKILAKYHKKGIFSITQLAHLFSPRRRSKRKPKIATSYMWELKALAIREHDVSA